MGLAQEVLDRYFGGGVSPIAGIGIEDITAEALAAHATVPVINGMTDFAHPCQVLGDLMTLRERDPILEEQHLCFIGDGNNVCSSLIVGCLKTGMQISVACPEGYEPPKVILDFARSYGDKFRLLRDPAEPQRALLSSTPMSGPPWDRRPSRRHAPTCSRAPIR